MPVLIDTGVLLRAFVRADVNCETVRLALRHLIRTIGDVSTTFQNIAEFHSVATRPPSERGGYGLTSRAVKQRIRFVERLCRIRVETEESYWQWRTLIDKYQVKGVAVHDARLVAVMKASGVDRILTFNDRDFRRFEAEGIVVVTPRQLVTEL